MRDETFSLLGTAVPQMKNITGTIFLVNTSFPKLYNISVRVQGNVIISKTFHLQTKLF